MFYQIIPWNHSFPLNYLIECSIKLLCNYCITQTKGFAKWKDVLSHNGWKKSDMTIRKEKGVSKKPFSSMKEKLKLLLIVQLQWRYMTSWAGFFIISSKLKYKMVHKNNKLLTNSCHWRWLIIMMLYSICVLD